MKTEKLVVMGLAAAGAVVAVDFLVSDRKAESILVNICKALKKLKTNNIGENSSNGKIQ